LSTIALWPKAAKRRQIDAANGWGITKRMEAIDHEHFGPILRER